MMVMMMVMNCRSMGIWKRNVKRNVKSHGFVGVLAGLEKRVILLFQATSSKASVNTLPRACRD